MALVHGDPEAIFEFANALDQFCNEVRGRLGAMAAHLDAMGVSAWTDARYQAYAEEFAATVASFHRVLGEIQPAHITYLHQKAQELDDFLNG